MFKAMTKSEAKSIERCEGEGRELSYAQTPSSVRSHWRGIRLHVGNTVCKPNDASNDFGILGVTYVAD